MLTVTLLGVLSIIVVIAFFPFLHGAKIVIIFYYRQILRGEKRGENRETHPLPALPPLSRKRQLPSVASDSSPLAGGQTTPPNLGGEKREQRIENREERRENTPHPSAPTPQAQATAPLGQGGKPLPLT